jgi:hypothetical protein
MILMICEIFLEALARRHKFRDGDLLPPRTHEMPSNMAMTAVPFQMAFPEFFMVDSFWLAS